MLDFVSRVCSRTVAMSHLAYNDRQHEVMDPEKKRPGIEGQA